MISFTSIASLTVATVFLLALPVAVCLWWKRKGGAEVSWRPLFIGAAGFVVCARVLETLVHVVCLMLDNPISRYINGHTAAYVLYGILMAGIFEECGRYVIMRYIMKRNKTPKNMVMYGIGHGGIEVWTTVLPSILVMLAVALLMNGVGLEQTMTALAVTGETAALGFEQIVDGVRDFGVFSALMCVAERVFAMTLHVSLTLVVFQGVRLGKKRYLLLAVTLHAVFNLFAALAQRGVVGIWLAELWLLVWAVAIGLTARRLYRAMGEQTASEEA